MAIYKKGGDESGLRVRAMQQGIEEADVKRKMTPMQQLDRETSQGVRGAKNAVNLNTTVHEARTSPNMLGGPVSGAALAKLKDKKSAAKKTKEKEMKRR
jgi:hypothetical protein